MTLGTISFTSYVMIFELRWNSVVKNGNGMKTLKVNRLPGGVIVTSRKNMAGLAFFNSMKLVESLDYIIHQGIPTNRDVYFGCVRQTLSNKLDTECSVTNNQRMIKPTASCLTGSIRPSI